MLKGSLHLFVGLSLVPTPTKCESVTFSRSKGRPQSATNQTSRWNPYDGNYGRLELASGVPKASVRARTADGGSEVYGKIDILTRSSQGSREICGILTGYIRGTASSDLRWTI
ncbi:hypothetical protein BGZ60DRAFT_138687 [Tricladium varicosporioides]|nr:hypothetical protein BGZ60DRAFT_138687 [Hymenoscyphus varicosporioides]